MQTGTAALQSDFAMWLLVVLAVSSIACISAVVAAASAGSGYSTMRSTRPAMPRGRLMRILAGIFLPAPLGALLMIVGLAASRLQMPDIQSFLIVTAWAYLFVGLQSILMSLLMELWVNPRVSSNGFAIAVAAILGAIALPSSLGAVFVGAGVGAAVGGIMRWMWVKRMCRES